MQLSARALAQCGGPWVPSPAPQKIKNSNNLPKWDTALALQNRGLFHFTWGVTANSCKKGTSVVSMRGCRD